MTTRGLVLAFGFLLLVGAFAGFARPAAAQDPTGQYGGDVRVALQGFGGLDPTTASPADRRALELVYDSLARIDPVTLQLTPWAALSWAYDGAKNITVTLRNDLRFSDGTAYDADDVAYSLNHYMKGGTQRWQAFVTNPTTVRVDFTAINPGTWDFRTSNQAGPGLFYTEGLTAMLAWDAAGTRKYSGPYAVTASTGTSLALAPNEHHFAGRVFLDSVTYVWPYTMDLNTDGTSRANDGGCALMFRQVHLIGWPLIANDLTNPRDCVAGFGGFADGNNKSLLNPDPAFSVPFVLTAKNPGNDFLYFGFTVGASSMFTGAPGTQGEKLRSAIYMFVNKGLYRDIEPNSRVTHGLVNQFNTPWAPLTCAPWTPCNFVMEAGTVAAPAPVLRRTNTDPGTQALNNAGVVDMDGDGIRQLSTGAPVTFRILAPSFTLDPRKTTIANDMQFLLRNSGLDVIVDPYDSWAALDTAAAGCTTGCVYIKRYTGATQLPDWYYSVPELLAANDPLVNLHLNLGAASSFTHAARSLHVGHVSHLAGQAADLIPVLHFDALEAFDFETFEGWVNTFGGINNFWSLTSLHLPNLGSLTAVVDIFPTMSLGPGDTTDVQITVRDETAQSVAGVTVELSVTTGTLGATTGTTDAGGIFTTTYTAPASIAAVQDATITAVVWAGQWVGADAANTVTLHPAEPGDLEVSVNRGTQAVIDSGDSVTITVEVRDPVNPVQGASVRLSTDLPGAEFMPASGVTGPNGQFTATFTANVTQGMTYRIFADASLAGFEDNSNRDSPAALSVRSSSGTVSVVDSVHNVPGFEAAAAVGALGVVFVLVAVARRRRED